MKTVLICSILLLVLSAGMVCTDMVLGMIEANPATSCNEIYKCNCITRRTISDGFRKATSNMKSKCGEGGWMQVLNLDMNKDTTYLSRGLANYHWS